MEALGTRREVQVLSSWFIISRKKKERVHNWIQYVFWIHLFSPSFPLGLFLCSGTRVALDAWMEIRGVGGVTAKKKE